MELFKLLGTIAVDNSEAKKALKETSDAAKDTAGDISDTSDSAETAGGKWSNAFKKIGSGALALGKTVVAGIGVAAGGVAALATKAIQSYADYEQLVGGVDTLFKESSAKVQEYAKNAYKTAGLSANEYMETVTSFSASLLQSLGGDTEAAAEMANMAITDMSDNANKMGTDMTMIQNAYNGFAKQNYTMLDNLKLGYGGTQEEMQRLLADAQAISGIEYDISSYADIVDAIHVIQTEMGITGTTAKEASSTISGSIASMKSSWQNLLTAISSDDLPFDDYVNSFVNSVSTVAGNLIPRIQIVLQGVVQLVDQLAPVIIGKIPELFAQLLPAVVNAATGLIQSLVAALPGVLSALMGALPALISGIQQIFNALVMALPQLMQLLVSALPTLIPMLIDALVSMIMTVLGALPQIIQPIIDYLPDIIISVVDTLLKNLPILIDGCLQLILALVDALPQLVTAIVEILPTIIEMISDALIDNLPILIDAVITIVMALVDALPEIIMALVQALPGILKSVWDAIVKVFENLPQWFGQIWDGVKNITANLWESIKTIFAPVAEWFNKNVIKPVADFFKGLWDKLVEIWDGICNAVKFAINLIASILDAAFQIITLPFRFIWENCKEYVFAAWEWIKEKVSTAINAIKDVISTVMNAIKGVFTTVWNAIKNVFTTVWNSISSFLTPILNTIKNAISTAFNAVKNTVSNIFNSVKTTVSNIWNSIKSTISNVANSIKDTVSNVFNKVKDAMSTPIEKARDLIKGIVDKIKGFFSGMKLSFPNIKMPHFKISPSGWKIGDLLEGSIPKLAIDWYAKAMNNPMVMTKPTVFGYNAATGTLQAGGEAGSEVVSGTNTLMNLIGSVVEGKNERIIAVLIAILNAITGGNAELIEAILADKSFVIGEREFARAVKTYA